MSRHGRLKSHCQKFVRRNIVIVFQLHLPRQLLDIAKFPNKSVYTEFIFIRIFWLLTIPIRNILVSLCLVIQFKKDAFLESIDQNHNHRSSF